MADGQTTKGNEDITSKGGNVPQGWRRWERARRNAQLRPESPAAKLYNKRVTNALSAAHALPDVPLVFENAYSVRWGGKARRHYFCGPYCAALHLQVGDKNPVVPRMDEQQDEYTTLLQLRVEELPRVVRCFVCNNEIGKNTPKLNKLVKETTVFTPPAEDKVVIVVDQNGDIIEPNLVRAVSLGEEAAELFTHYLTSEARQAYVIDHGKKVTFGTE